MDSSLNESPFLGPQNNIKTLNWVLSQRTTHMRRYCFQVEFASLQAQLRITIKLKFLGMGV